jgi:SAM-dependent methyltransferase
MNFFDLVNISERYIELVNPSTPEKVLTIGQFLGLKAGSRVIDFGCGYGEVLALWAERFGIAGIELDVREHACDRARKKMSERGLAARIEIVCMNAAEYSFEKQAFDVAACIGASFIWGGYRPTIHAMKDAIHADGKLVIGEPYWLTEHVPPEYAKGERVHTEYELLQIAHDEGFDFEYMVRASHDDRGGYEAGNWYGLVRWLEENPEHPERQEVIDHLHKIQDEYLRYGREYMGWAMYILNPINY